MVVCCPILVRSGARLHDRRISVRIPADICAVPVGRRRIAAKIAGREVFERQVRDGQKPRLGLSSLPDTGAAASLSSTTRPGSEARPRRLAAGHRSARQMLASLGAPIPSPGCAMTNRSPKVLTMRSSSLGRVGWTKQTATSQLAMPRGASVTPSDQRTRNKA